MGYNKASEERKWKKWKKIEERILRQQGMSEEKILELREYDWKLFKADRRFREKQFTNNDLMDYMRTVTIQLPLKDFNDILEQIEDVKVYNIMKKQNIQTMDIIFLKINGYTNKEISSILGIKESIIRQRLFVIRKKLKK